MADFDYDVKFTQSYGHPTVALYKDDFVFGLGHIDKYDIGKAGLKITDVSDKNQPMYIKKIKDDNHYYIFSCEVNSEDDYGLKISEKTYNDIIEKLKVAIKIKNIRYDEYTSDTILRIGNISINYDNNNEIVTNDEIKLMQDDEIVARMLKIKNKYIFIIDKDLSVITDQDMCEYIRSLIL